LQIIVLVDILAIADVKTMNISSSLAVPAQKFKIMSERWMLHTITGHLFTCLHDGWL
jgi:hypothetical protein